MKKKIALLLGMVILMTSIGITGCSAEKKPEENDDTKVEETEEDTESDTSVVIGDTLGWSIYAEFIDVTEEKDDVVDIAEALATEDITGYNCMSMEVQPGYLNGFTTDITEFDEGAMFAPVIGSVPFVAYIFKTDDAEGLKETLLANSDPRWNICTEADETLCETYGDYVFFIMCPNE